MPVFSLSVPLDSFNANASERIYRQFRDKTNEIWFCYVFSCVLNTLLLIRFFVIFQHNFFAYLELFKPPLKFMLTYLLISPFIYRSRNLSIYLIFLRIMIYTENYGKIIRNKMQWIIWTGQRARFQFPGAEGISPFVPTSRPILGRNQAAMNRSGIFTQRQSGHRVKLIRSPKTST
jgi:hypothetical protein